MSKQIEEIRETINDFYGTDAMYYGVDSNALAHHLYKADYRKRTKGAGKWVSAAKRLPEESGKYLVVTGCRNIDVLEYSAKCRLFNAFDDLDPEINVANAIHVTHWMPLPKPPEMKGSE